MSRLWDVTYGSIFLWKGWNLPRSPSLPSLVVTVKCVEPYGDETRVAKASVLQQLCPFTQADESRCSLCKCSGRYSRTHLIFWAACAASLQVCGGVEGLGILLGFLPF